MGRLFGTDGVRGLAGTELTADLARDLGVAAVRVLGDTAEPRPVFVVGRDPRSSGVWLESALVEGITSAGGDAWLAGVEPTPAIAFLTTDLGASSGIVISASHNPPEYNGIKLFSSAGMKLSDALEDEIEAAMTEQGGEHASGEVRQLPEEGRERYLVHLLDSALTRLDGMRVVVDCANGSASVLAPEVLRRLGADVTAINAEPDGSNINDGCGALHPDVVAAEVVRLGADAGVSHDGDADRALFADAEGNVIDGDQVLAACAVAMKADGSLGGDAVVGTVMSNVGFLRAMQRERIRVVQAAVGDRYVLEAMEANGIPLGGEPSGHVIFRSHASTGDGLLTAVRFLSLAAERGATIGDLAAVMRRFPQVMLNVTVRDREALSGAEPVWEAVSGAEGELGDRGRVLVRASGTEPLVRVMVEAETQDEARTHAESIADVVRAELG
ncbi:MAG: phosphoglucosamine mutase [Actinomycetota bacterium]